MKPNFRLNRPDLKERRQLLRNRSTPAELFLWKYLKGQKTGYKFQRQYSVDYYILDFYCPEKRLGIELDGNQHDIKETSEYDKHRTYYLSGFNIKIIRFRNDEVLGNVQEVLSKIISSLLG